MFGTSPTMEAKIKTAVEIISHNRAIHYEVAQKASEIFAQNHSNGTFTKKQLLNFYDLCMWVYFGNELTKDFFTALLNENAKVSVNVEVALQHREVLRKFPKSTMDFVRWRFAIFSKTERWTFSWSPFYDALVATPKSLDKSVQPQRDGLSAEARSVVDGWVRSALCGVTTFHVPSNVKCEFPDLHGNFHVECSSIAETEIPFLQAVDDHKGTIESLFPGVPWSQILEISKQITMTAGLAYTSPAQVSMFRSLGIIMRLMGHADFTLMKSKILSAVRKGRTKCLFYPTRTFLELARHESHMGVVLRNYTSQDQLSSALKNIVPNFCVDKETETISVYWKNPNTVTIAENNEELESTFKQALKALKPGDQHIITVKQSQTGFSAFSVINQINETSRILSKNLPFSFSHFVEVSPDNAVQVRFFDD